MRQIKFRAWQKHHKQMVKVTRIDFNRNLITADYGEKTVPRFNTFEQDNFILMQYTGFRDKNGTEIYEGDLLFDKDELTRPFIVKWDDEWAQFYVDCGGGSTDFLWKWANLEVIGNIYENPDLLAEVSE
jgi:uncharacterized phage protein (TIGR01671 family)